jgi:hypothetical protein
MTAKNRIQNAISWHYWEGRRISHAFRRIEILILLLMNAKRHEIVESGLVRPETLCGPLLLWQFAVTKK